jgi:hypothetical protein
VAAGPGDAAAAPSAARRGTPAQQACGGHGEQHKAWGADEGLESPELEAALRFADAMPLDGDWRSGACAARRRSAEWRWAAAGGKAAPVRAWGQTALTAAGQEHVAASGKDNSNDNATDHDSDSSSRKEDERLSADEEEGSPLPEQAAGGAEGEGGWEGLQQWELQRRRKRSKRTLVSLADFPESLLPWRAVVPAPTVLAERGLLRPQPVRTAKLVRDLRSMEGPFAGGGSLPWGTSPPVPSNISGGSGSLVAQAAFSQAGAPCALRAAVAARPGPEQVGSGRAALCWQLLRGLVRRPRKLMRAEGERSRWAIQIVGQPARASPPPTSLFSLYPRRSGLPAAARIGACGSGWWAWSPTATRSMRCCPGRPLPAASRARRHSAWPTHRQELPARPVAMAAAVTFKGAAARPQDWKAAAATESGARRTRRLWQLWSARRRCSSARSIACCPSAPTARQSCTAT